MGFARADDKTIYEEKKKKEYTYARTHTHTYTHIHAYTRSHTHVNTREKKGDTRGLGEGGWVRTDDEVGYGIRGRV